MSDKKKPGKRVFNHMVRVQCPKSGALQWANVGSRSRAHRNKHNPEDFR